MCRAMFLLALFVVGSVLGSNPIKRYNDFYDILSWNQSSASLDVECRDPECQNAAKEILSLNSSVDPCDNFYDFACQVWEKENPRPDYMASLTALSKMEVATNDIVIEILSEPANEVSDIPALIQAKEYYKQCLDVVKEADAIEQHNETMQKILDTVEEFGGWPILYEEGEWDRSRFNMLKSMVALRNKFNSINILDISVYQDSDNVNSNAIILRRPTTSSDEESSIAESSETETETRPISPGLPKKIRLRRDFIMNITREFLRFQGVTNINETKLEQQAFFILWLPVKLVLAEERQNYRDIFGFSDNFANTTLDKLQTLMDKHAVWFDNQLDLNELLRLTFMDSGIDISKSENVITNNLDYLLGVSMLLPEIKTEVIANYLHYQMVIQMIYLLPSSKFQDIISMYKHTLDGTTRPNPRSQICAAKIQQRFAVALAHKFAQKKYSDDLSATDQDFEQVQKMFDNVRHSFRTLVYSSAKIDPFFKRRLSLRLFTIGFCPGNPSWIYNDDFVQRKYEDLILRDTNYLEQTITINEWAAMKKLQTLRQPEDTDKCKWNEFIGSNIAFNQFRNVYVPMGIMKTNFFNLNLPKSIVYGKLGSILGHEIAHIASWDGDGWTTSLNGSKMEASNCFVNYYNNFTYDELDDKDATLDGERTLSENLSDNAGILAAYLAFKTDFSVEVSKRMVGLEKYTDDQLFYIAFAQNWCASNSLENMRNSLTSGVHSPGRFRVLGTLKNSMEFAQAWKCPVGSKMNPGATDEPKRCQIF